MRATDFEISNYHKLDKILSRLCEMVVEGNTDRPEYYGMVAAAVLDPSNQIVARINRPGQDGKRVHAESAAMQDYIDRYGPIPKGSIVITTLSPCNEAMHERDGPSCTDLINRSTIKKVYCGYMDPTQDDDTRQFTLMATADQELRRTCKLFADTFLDNTDESVVEGRKRKKKKTSRSLNRYFFPGFGYYGSGESGEGGDGGGGESVNTGLNEDAVMGKIEQSGQIVRILKKQHTVPFSSDKDWLLIDTDPAKGNKGLGIKWIPADTRFEWVRPYRDTVDENFANYQGVRPPKNIPGTNLFPGQDIVGQRVYHCTNRLEAIKKSGGLKPRRDATGEREYGRLSTDEHPFIPVIGIWFSVGKPDWPGKHCVSFVIEPTDQVYVAYANTKGLKPNVVLNPIALDRLTVEGQQDVAENFADGKNPQDKGDSKRHGINTKASVSSLRKTAKQGGRKGQLAHWLANMKSGRAKANKK